MSAAPRCLLVSAIVLGLTGVGSPAAAQEARPEPAVVRVAAAPTGAIAGTVLDERGQPLDGVVVSAIGQSQAFAVTDEAGAFTLRRLSPGPYLLRAHLDGYSAARSTLVEVRPAASTPSSFTLRRDGAAAPRVMTAGLTGVVEDEGVASENPKSETELAWWLRRLPRSILKDGATHVDVADTDSSFVDSFDFLGRAVGSSARMAASFFSGPAFEGQVHLLTTSSLGGAEQPFDPATAGGVAFMSIGGVVGDQADWNVKVAMNQGDLSSWMLAGGYAVRAPARHRYEVGWSYSTQRYEGGNPATLASVADGHRNVGMVYAHDEFAITPRLSVGLGARYARYDYVAGQGFFSPRASVSFSPVDRYRVHASASLSHTVPGAEEFLPESRAAFLPPQRTFAPMAGDGFRREAVEHYEVGVSREFDGATVGVRAFRQQVDNQLVTVFGLITPRTPVASIGHYYVASAGNVSLEGWGVTLTHALTEQVRGSVDYSQSTAEWIGRPPAGDLEMLAAWVPSAVLPDEQRLHDLSTSLEAEVPHSATRLYVLYRVNSAFLRRYGRHERPGIDGRFDIQVNQGLPFLNFTNAQWEMLFGIRNLFREDHNGSAFGELLVVRPPKRIVGGVQVRF